MEQNDFVPNEKTRVKRSHERARYDRAAVYGILDAGLVCHVGYVIDGQPYVTPTCHWRREDKLYWHGSSASRMLRRVRDGVPVCVTVTLLDGLVLARSGYHHSINYRSVMAFGRARAIEERAAMLSALEDFTERLLPGRWPELRPPSEQEIKATCVVEMDLTEVSAKIRQGPPLDETEDYALPVWAGEVPIARHIGRAVPDPKLAPGIALPDYLAKIRVE
jgi:nitroimidazol reductase NimA-like FMN-containing flavoprotein (pyridoxamine 5'-phosphate oxidase superfamily)